MKWARFESLDAERSESPLVGIVVEDCIFPVAEVGSVRGILSLDRSEAETLATRAMKLSGIKLSDVRLLPPIEPSGDVIAIGRNYADHAGEMAKVGGVSPQPPTVFSKAQTTISGPYDDIVVDPRISSQVDWEAELGVVLGRTCRDLEPQGALACVFGYTVLNDISARDIQYGWGGQFYKGKSVDGYCPIGPWIVTADEISDPQDLEITLHVNDVLKQHGKTSDMIYSVVDIIAWVSMGQTLMAGTVIATGTPAGVGYAREPKEFLTPGDVMTTAIDKIGSLRNLIVRSAL